MTRNPHTTHIGGITHPDVDDIAHLRPSGHALMMLLRAACADDGHGGPYLSIEHATTASGAAFFRTHVSVAYIEWHSPRCLVLMTGDDALAYAARYNWPLGAITDPTTANLRELGTYAVGSIDALRWSLNYTAWRDDYTTVKAIKAREIIAAEHMAAARALRWQLAEAWMRG